jgi:cytochrome P450
MVLDLEDVVQSKAQKLSAAVQKGFESGKPVDLFHGFRSLAIDVISDFGFDKCYNLLDREDFREHFHTMIQLSNRPVWAFQQWPLIRKTVLSMPESWVKQLSSAMKGVYEFRQHCLEAVLEVKNKMETGEMKPDSKPTLFQRLLTPGIVSGYNVPSPANLSDEAYTVLGAAGDTTGNTLTTATYHAVSNPSIYNKLTAELKQAFPDPNSKLDYVTLEKLPYLTGVIKEGLRLSFGVPGRLPRVVPETGAVFEGYAVPRGTVVGMSSWTLHNNPAYFENPTTFDPDRWSDPEKSKIMEKAFIPFSKGSKACVGKELAYSEIYIALGTLFRRFENMQSNVLTEEDRRIIDYFPTYYPLDATKFHVSARVY